jgi:hypothetical protein
MNICADILQNIENDSNCLENKKKARQIKSKFKAMMVVFFDIREIVHVNWVPECQTVNQVYYKEVLTNLRVWVRITPCLSRCF